MIRFSNILYFESYNLKSTSWFEFRKVTEKILTTRLFHLLKTRSLEGPYY